MREEPNVYMSLRCWVKSHFDSSSYTGRLFYPTTIVCQLSLPIRQSCALVLESPTMLGTKGSCSWQMSGKIKPLYTPLSCICTKILTMLEGSCGNKYVSYIKLLHMVPSVTRCVRKVKTHTCSPIETCFMLIVATLPSPLILYLWAMLVWQW